MDEPQAKRVKVEENVFLDSKVNEKDEENFQLFDEIMRNVKIEQSVNYLEDPEYIQLLNVLKKRKDMINKVITKWSCYLEIHNRYLNSINYKLFELNEMQMNLLPDNIYFNIILREDYYKNKLKIMEIRIIKIKNILTFLESLKITFNMQLLHNSLKYPLLKSMIDNYQPQPFVLII
jgi:hypothetical protein